MAAAAHLYEQSGKVGFLGLVAGVGTTLVLGPVLGGIYAAAIAYIPFIYVNVLLTLLFGAATGFAITFAMKMGKVRNTWVMVGGAFLGTCFVHYVGWMIWMAVMCFRSDIPVPFFEIVFPITFLMMVVELSEVGAWSIGSSGTAVTGVFLWIVWGLEALIVFGTSLAVAFFTADSEPFCEECETWCDPHDDVLRLSGQIDGGQIGARLMSSDLGVLSQATRAHPQVLEWNQVDLCRCRSCGKTNTLTLSHVHVTFDKKGNKQVHKRALVNRMLLTPEQADWVSGVASSPGPMEGAPQR